MLHCPSGCSCGQPNRCSSPDDQGSGCWARGRPWEPCTCTSGYEAVTVETTFRSGQKFHRVRRCPHMFESLAHSHASLCVAVHLLHNARGDYGHMALFRPVRQEPPSLPSKPTSIPASIAYVATAFLASTLARTVATIAIARPQHPHQYRRCRWWHSSDRRSRRQRRDHLLP
jgi:hypothetical protein